MRYELKDKQIADLQDEVYGLMVSEHKYKNCCEKYKVAGERVTHILQEIIKIGHVCTHEDVKMCRIECFNEQAQLASRPLLEFETIKRELECDDEKIGYRGI